MTRPEPASAVPLRQPATGWEDILDALGVAAERTAAGIDCTVCATAAGDDLHDEDWARVNRWRALAVDLRGQLTDRTASERAAGRTPAHTTQQTCTPPGVRPPNPFPRGAYPGIPKGTRRIVDHTSTATLPNLPPGVRIPGNLSEPDAFRVLAALVRRFGWAYVIWNRDTVNGALDDLDWRRPATQQAWQLSDEQWRRVTQTPAWRETIPDIAITQVADEDLLTDAILQAAVVCAECLAPLADPPTVTGRLCQRHRTGPAGQPAVADPATEGLYWLDGDTLTYAPIDSQRRSPCKDAGEPVDWNELDPLATYRAEQAQAALRALADPTTTTPTVEGSESDNP